MKTSTCLAALTLLALSPARAATVAPPPAASTVPEPAGQGVQPGAAAASQKPTIRFDKTWTPSPNKAVGTPPEPVGAAGTPPRSGSTTATLPPTPAVPRHAELARPGHPVADRSQRPVTAHRRLHVAKKIRAMQAARGGTPSRLDQLIDRLTRHSHSAIPEGGSLPSPAEPAPPIARTQPLPHPGRSHLSKSLLQM
jgi:hypothetical protein